MNGHNDVLAGALVVNDSKIYEKLKLIQIKFGLTCSPFDCYLVNRGIKTLSLRMQKHSDCILFRKTSKSCESYPSSIEITSAT